jgi:uncharacterized protein YpiB (UPF0302 family)
MLNESVILKALKRLSEILEESNESRTLLLVGGAALKLLGFQHKAVTTDIDNLLPMDEILKNAVDKIAIEMNLHENWLNSHSSSFLDKNIDYTKNAKTVIKTNSLTVNIVSIENFIELKVRAQIDRGFDLPDIIALKPTKDHLFKLKQKILSEGHHHVHVVEEDFRIIFRGLGYDD